GLAGARAPAYLLQRDRAARSRRYVRRVHRDAGRADHYDADHGLCLRAILAGLAAGQPAHRARPDRLDDPRRFGRAGSARVVADGAGARLGELAVPLVDHWRRAAFRAAAARLAE